MRNNLEDYSKLSRVSYDGAVTTQHVARPDGRRERSRVTRERVVRAAYDLFCDRGLSVPLAEIARRADVSVQTVYVAFQTKDALLGEVLRHAVHGDDSPLPPHERPWFAEMAAEPDPRRAIGILLRGTQGIYDRVGPLAGIFRTSEPAVAEMWHRSEELRYQGMRAMTKALLEKGPVRKGVDLRSATDVVFVLLSADNHQSFRSLGWSVRRWQSWVTETLTVALFDAGERG